MNFFGSVFALLFALFPVTSAMGKELPELSLQSQYEQSPDPLTTEKIWAIEPGELNPHRTRWVLKRHMKLSGLQAVPEKSTTGDTYVARMDSLSSKTMSYIRGPTDPGYSTIRDFPCTATPQEWFATLDGTRFASDRAAKLWEDLLSKELFKLSVMLRHVHGEFPENTIQDSNFVLSTWKDQLERTWKDHILPQVRLEEWKLYEKQAREAAACKPGIQKTRRSWYSMMEKPPTGDTPLTPVARAPARRWGGLYSVLVTMKVGGQELVGKFLLDSAAPQSVISPAFLQNQGALASWIQIPKGKPQKISWSGGFGIASPAYVGEVQISGLSIPVHQFFIHDTDFFGPPESFAACCDGILGADFLRQYAVELRPGKTSEVNLYSREGFRPGGKLPWVETSFNREQEIVSDCTAQAKSSVHEVIQGVKWDTGSEDALELNRSTGFVLKPGLRWLLDCGSTRLAENALILPKEQGMNSTVSLDAGMELMGRGQVFLDLGHGRIWFNPQGLALPIVQNHSGLNLEFTYYDGNRYLKVVGIGKRSPAESLRKAGLQPGMTILSIDSKSADEMDTWEVEQRLSGAYADSVALEWKTGKKSSKIAPLKLPPMSP